MADIKTFETQVQAAMRSEGGLDRNEAATLQAGFSRLTRDPATQQAAFDWLRGRADTPMRELLLGGSYDQYTGPKATSRAADARAAQVLAGAGKLGPELERTPDAVRSVYDLSLSADRSVLTADPARRGGATRSIGVTDSARGGKEMRLEGGPFDQGRWLSSSFRQVLEQRLGSSRASAELEKLERAGFDLDTPRDILAVNGESDRQPTLIAFSRDARQRGAVTICDEVAVHDFNSRGGVATLRKPVIYVYPREKTRIRVDVELAGDFTVLYPKPNRPSSKSRVAWEVVATPEGTLFVPETERVYGYLFWEGEAPRVEVNLDKADCVAGSASEEYLERATRRLGLNDRERTDFVSYWLPHLEKNPFNAVEWLSNAAYERYATLKVTPQPDYTLRIFMVFRGVAEPVEVGAAEIPQGRRGGFTVVEWGGADLTPA